MQEMKYFNEGNDCDICKNQLMTGRDGTVEDCRRRQNGLSCRFEERDIKDWKRCAALRTLKDFRGSKCYVGVDLSSGGDLTSIAIVIPYMVDGVKKYFVHTHSFIPASRVDEHIKTDKVPYDVWISKGLVTVTETLGGIKTDYKYIIKYLEDLIKQNDLKPQLVCYDPHNASAFLSDLGGVI